MRRFHRGQRHGDADLDTLINHAKLFWDGEQKNADHLHVRRRILMGLLTVLIAVAGVFSSVSTQIVPIQANWMFAVLGSIVASGMSLLAWRDERRVGCLAGIGAALCITSWIAEAVRFWQVGSLASIGAGAVLGCGVIAGAAGLFALKHLFAPASNYQATRQENGSRSFTLLSSELPPDPSLPASAWFLLSPRRIQCAAGSPASEKRSSFVRIYSAASTLFGRNIELADRVRSAQAALLFVAIQVCAIFLISVQVTLATLPNKGIIQVSGEVVLSNGKANRNAIIKPLR